MANKEKQARERGPRIVWVEETNSTNSLAREWMEKEPMPEGSAIVADFQTAGRGQVGNTWESEAGKNLLFSVVLYPVTLPANRQFLISQIAALSVKETLDLYTDDITVKWPNDISDSIIGIGLNLNQATFLSDAPNPVSLFQILHREVNREEVLRRFLTIFYAHYISLLREEYDEIRACYRSVLYRGEGFYRYQDAGGMFEARVRDIEPTGHLLLESRDGSVRRYAFKEVAFR